MKKIALIVCTFLVLASTYGASTNFMVNLASAKHKAGVEGKLYMVHFTANWCTPCKWMSSHTFTDDRVAQYLTDNYVPVKIDVEDFDGIIIKQKNNVQFLPTILIFNSQGEEVGRFEEAIGPSKLMAILEENNIPTNKVKLDLPEPSNTENPSSISRPILPSIFDDSEEVSNTNTENENELEEITNTGATTPESELPVYTPPSNENMDEVELTPTDIESPTPISENETSTHEIQNNVVDNSAAESLAFLTGEGIFELDVKYKSKEGYSVQIGLYAKYENVLAEVNKFKRMYQQDVFVHIGKRNGVTVYRLLMGNFNERHAANQLEFDLKNKGLDCFVSDLARL